MQLTNSQETDRVRANTDPEVLRRIDEAIEQKIRFYSTQPRELISRRINELSREWDIERVLETNASSLALMGLALGVVRSRKFLVLSGAVLSFLLLHAVQGWCPPVPLLRKYGVRTKSEIEREKFALKILRGDFQDVSPMAEETKQRSGEILSALKS